MRTAIYTALLLLLFSAVQADECVKKSDDCAVIGKWDFGVAVGYGVRSNPVIDQRDIKLYVLPMINYYGKRFFLNNLDLGYTLLETERHTLNVLATPGYDSVFFNRNDPQNYLFDLFGAGEYTNTVGGDGSGVAAAPISGLAPPTPTLAERILQHKRRFTYLVGPEWTFAYRRVTTQLDAVYEVTGEHDGFEIRGALATPLIDGTHKLTMTTGFTWKSAKLVTYFYGEPGLYNAGSAFDPFIKLKYSHMLNRHWNLIAFARLEWLQGGIADSPIIVNDRVISMFGGVTYSF